MRFISKNMFFVIALSQIFCHHFHQNENLLNILRYRENFDIAPRSNLNVRIREYVPSVVQTTKPSVVKPPTPPSQSRETAEQPANQVTESSPNDTPISQSAPVADVTPPSNEE